ncbi:hypothetical protein AWZ03_001330 [Drosophila navojoa]|uniref:RRM domain-containing protein n=2 Tax=Drosophila navojoa TaxID=7232 RepID=A0A484BTC2_DRONA|nr:hypothetical protein AWZ03_001330 [Drosophila navojoa]
MVDYLPGDMQKNELYQLFKSFGQLYDLKIIRDPETGASHCCGFISYVNSMSANRALKAMNGCRLRGMKLKVSWSPIINADRHKIYVANLPLTYNAAKVRQIFERFGKVVYVNLLKNRHTHRSRGVAFVRYEMKDSIDRAILAGNNLVLEHGHPPLYVRLAYPSKVWPVSPEPDEPVPVPSNSAVETPSVAQPSTDTHVDSPKEEIKQSVNPKCFVFGQVDNATADATAASSLKPKTSLNYKYLMHFRSAPVAPALAASNESVDLAAIRDNVPEKAANGVSSVLTTGSNAAKIRIRRQLRFKIPYKRFVAIPKPDDI